MSKSIALGLVGAGAVLLAILLTGCTDAPSPTPSARAVPSPTVTAQFGVTPEPTPASTTAPTHTPTPEPTPTPTSAPTHTPTPEPTPATVTLPLGVYLTLCAPRDLGLADDLTFGDFSSELAAEADRFEALTPPAQLSEWHLLNIAAYRTAQALVDIQPKDDVVDFASSFLTAVELAFIEELREAAARAPEDVRQQMIEAGCIDPDAVPGDYEDVPDDHGNDIDDATVAAVGADVEGVIDYEGDSDYFRFTAEEGQLYQIDVALGSLPDSLLALLGPDGWELTYNDDHGDSLASRVVWEAPESGDYYLVVEAGGFDADVGAYTLTVSHSTIVDDYGNDIDDATVAAVAVGVGGVIDYEGDSDYFRFTAEEGQLYQIDVVLGSLPDSLLALLGPDGWELTYNDDHGDSLASRVVWEAPASGDYYLAVEAGGFDADVGAYTLTVSYSTIVDDYGNDINSATVATVGADVEGVIDYQGDSDYFRFTAEEGQLYQIDVALGTLPDSYLELLDSDGWQLTYNDDHGDSLASRVVWEAPESGDYYLAVEAGGWDAHVGSYALTVSHSTIVDDHGNDTDDATVAAVAVGVGGVIDYEGDLDYFRFTAEEGQLYQIDVALGSLPDSLLALLGPDGWELTYNDDHGDSLASRVVWEAPASGDYYLVVEASGFDADVGAYTLTVSHSTIVDDYGNDIDDATVAAVAVGVGGVIDYEGDSDYFRFTAEEGQLYQIDVALGSLPDSLLALLGPDGWELTYNDDHGDSPASRVFWEAPASGDYYLAVEASGFDAQVGSYTLTVTRR